MLCSETKRTELSLKPLLLLMVIKSFHDILFLGDLFRNKKEKN